MRAHGAAVRVWDSRDQPPQAAALRAARAAAPSCFAGALDAGALDGVDRVCKSPGLAPATRASPAAARRGRAAGIPVHGELDLFARGARPTCAERDYAPKVIAITGTNGKTTTTR